MPDYDEFEEENFQAQITNKTLMRIAGLARPHWRWVVGFMLAITVVSMLDSIFTYLSKQIVDLGILGNNRAAVIHFITIYGALDPAASGGCADLHFPGGTFRRAHPL